MAINLGQRGLSIGRYGPQIPQMPPQMQPQAGQVVGDKDPQYGASARAYGLAEALQPIQVESGGWGEALAEALAGGLRGRAAQDQRQGEVDQEQWDQNRAQKQEQGVSDALANFDPSNPQGMVENLRGVAPGQALDLATALAGRGPQQQYGELERIDGRLGQRNQATNQYEWAPQVNQYQAGGMAPPPSGYRYTESGDLQAISGGPADIRATAEGRVHAQAMDSSIRQLENAIGVLDDALPDVNGGTSGLFADTTRDWGVNQGSTDLNEALEPVRAILSFESLQEMRRNSMTGGALGSIAVRELELLGNTVRSLSVRQSPEQLRANLTETRAQLARTLQAVQAARQEMAQGPDEAPMEPNMAGPPPPEQGGSGLESMSLEQLEQMRLQLRGQP